MEAMQRQAALLKMQQTIQRLAQSTKTHEFLLSNGAALSMPVLLTQS